MGRRSNSSSASLIETQPSSASSVSSSSLAHAKTDLNLRLTISPPSHSQNDLSSSSTPLPSKQRQNWQPIKPLLRSRLVEGNVEASVFFVKVHMEGIPIGRKLDLFAHQDYSTLIAAIAHMFGTTILCPEANRVHYHHDHVLIYEDNEGDWMMVGDVPWEMFLSSVKRLKITRADRC